MKQKNLKSIALFTAVCLLMALAFSFGFLVLNADHHCTGEHCNTCAHLAQVSIVLRYLSAFFLVNVCFSLLKSTQSSFHSFMRRTVPILCTPITMKVRLND